MDFVRGHPFVVASPIKGDSVLVPDARDPTTKNQEEQAFAPDPSERVEGRLAEAISTMQTNRTSWCDQ